MKFNKQILVNQIFQDVALLFGGVVALRHREISDAVIREIAKDLKLLHGQYIKETTGKGPGINSKPHPAIVELIRSIKASERRV